MKENLFKNEFIFPISIYTEDTDISGVVYHANHIKYMERGRTAWLLALGGRLDELMQQNCIFVVRNIAIEYLYPARLHDQLEVVSRLDNRGRTSLTFRQDIRLANQKERWISKGTVILVTINSKGKPVALPNQIKEMFDSP